MASDLDLAQQLKSVMAKIAAKTASSTVSTTIIKSGTATSNSADSTDGKTVEVILDAATVVTGEDDSQAVTLPTNVSVKTGDTVQVTCTAQGAKITSQIVTGVTGRGQEQADATATAQTTADDAKSAAADNASEIASIKTDYVTNSTFDQSNTQIKASVADTLTQAKTYTDGQVETEVTNRNAAITESASEIKSEVSETYATQDNLAAANSAITQNANAISSEVTARETTDSNVSTLSTKVTQNADSITTEISDRESAVSTVDAKAVAAQSTADDAKSTATTLSTLIRESSSGVDIGKSSDGGTYSTSVARGGSDGAFHILTSALVEVAKYAGTLIELGKNSTSAIIKFCGGLGEIGLLTDAETTFSPSFGLHSDAKPITLLYSHTVADSDFESGSHTAGSFPTGTKIDSSVAAGQANDYGGGEAAIMSSAVAPDGKHRAWGSVGLFSGFSDSTGTAIPSTDAPRISVRGGTSDGSTTSYFGGEYPLENLAHVLSETLLYNGGAALNYDTAPGGGTTGTVTLSETAANFSKIKIYAKYGTDTVYTEVYNPDGSDAIVQMFLSTGGPSTYTYIKSTRYAISGTSMTPNKWLAAMLNSTTSEFTSVSAPEISIIRVEGIR